MHDIGKVGVPDAILQKHGTLSPDERRVVEAHTEIGYEILAGSDNPVLELAATVALTHHERFDGEGYPRGLKAKEIPEPGRIAAVADVFDALTHDRAYRKRIQRPGGVSTSCARGEAANSTLRWWRPSRRRFRRSKRYASSTPTLRTPAGRIRSSSAQSTPFAR